MSEQIIARLNGRTGHISLNRPEALHALNLEMCEAMSDALLRWRNDGAVDAIILDHASGRGFCAGGDVAMVRRSALENGGKAGRAFFMAEYRLNHLLFTYPVPIIAFMDGVTMGGGVGLSLPATHRIATENTLFAMPEGAIGLFPDVGAGYYLPRLPGEVGKFLSLTGARLDGAECLWAGVATHFIASQDSGDVKRTISSSAHEIAGAIAAFTPADLPPARLQGNAPRIDRIFASETLEDIISALRADPSDWAAKELKAVLSKCPTSSKVALRLLARNSADFAEEMALEYAVAARMIMRADFAEGVRAVLVDKDNSPAWNPAGEAGVTDTLLDEIFAPLSPNQAWSPHPA